MQARPNHNIRFDSKAQVKRIKQAAQQSKRSFNQFVVLAVEHAAEKLLTSEKGSEQLTTESKRLTLNQ
jgi:uncharacterized protein (DUF1778 family)